MQSSEAYMQDLKQWLRDTADSLLEEMSDFFTKRLHDYEEHMLVWEEDYQVFAEALPLECQKVLDLGCGTGLELNKIWQKNPDIELTGVDLCANMLKKLLEKHHDKPFSMICQDYFQYDFGYAKWDAVISFESLHHFLPERKRGLYRKIFCSLKKRYFPIGRLLRLLQRRRGAFAQRISEKRKQSSISESCYVHFDIPLTLEHFPCSSQKRAAKLHILIYRSPC